MTEAYSLLLGLAASAAVLSWLLLAASRWWPATRRVSTVVACCSIVLDASSLANHLVAGHRPGSPESMTFGEFLAQHPAFVVVLLAAAVAVALARTIPRHARRAV